MQEKSLSEAIDPVQLFVRDRAYIPLQQRTEMRRGWGIELIAISPKGTDWMNPFC